jgi:hypothetical protein
LVNNGADGAPNWVWVFEAFAACQKCRLAAAAVVKLEAKLEEQPPGAGTGGGGAQDAGVAPPAKRQKPAASNGASPAEATAVPAVPAAAPQAAMHAVPQAAVHICNAMDGLPEDDRERCADLFRRLAARVGPVPLGCESYNALVRQRNKVLAKLKKGAGTISGDRYELWCIVVRVQGAAWIFVRSLPVCTLSTTEQGLHSNLRVRPGCERWAWQGGC